MNQSELVGLVAKRTGLSIKDTKAAVQTALEQIGAALKKGDTVRTALGMFKVARRAARKGRNPRTGEPVAIKARRAVRFRASTTLKHKLNGR